MKALRILWLAAALLVGIAPAQAQTFEGALPGTSGHAVPFLDGTNAWSSTQTFNTTAAGDPIIVNGTSTLGINIVNSSAFLRAGADFSSGAYNNILVAGDDAIIFSGTGGQNTGALTIAPWSTTGQGLRMQASGVLTLTGTFTVNGSTSGAQVWKPAATTSGTITWPSGTIDFSSTGGANQVVQQTSAGGIFTVGQLSVASLSGLPVTIAQGGTSQTTALAARGSGGLNIDECTSTGDANYTILSTDRCVYHTALSAARTDTLPAANSVNAGQVFYLTDFRGVASATNTITLSRAGADTINGGTTVVAINNGFGAAIYWSDGTSRWTFFPASAGGGGVTQVNSGYGLTGGPITSTGTLQAPLIAVSVHALLGGL